MEFNRTDIRIERNILLRITLRRIHLLLALLSGFLLINISISGGLLIYAKEIQTIINPQYWLLTDKQIEEPLLTLSEIT